MSGTNFRFPDPYFADLKNEELERFLSEFVRALHDFDAEIFREDTGLIFNTARKHPVVNTSVDYAMGPSDSLVFVDTGNGDVTVSLPAALNAYQQIYTIKNTATVNVVSVEGSGSEFPYVLPAGSTSAVSFASDGDVFWVVK